MTPHSIASIPDSPVYGPVFSWRFGDSLGVDILLKTSTCSFRCVYCQLGKINVLTTEREMCVPTERVLTAMCEIGWSDADVVTFSGSGEPTLAKNLGETIRAVKKLTGKPIVVLTNGTLLNDADVREELMEADHVSCKLDAPTDETLHALNRPAETITLETLLTGICRFREQFEGVLSIQTMLLPSNVQNARAFLPLLERIDPDEIYLNLPSRSIPKSWSRDARGGHVSFASEQGLRALSVDEVMAFKAEVEKHTRARVKVPPLFC